MGKSFHNMTQEEKTAFNERYIELYEQAVETTDGDEYIRLKDEMVLMEREAGLYGQL